MDEVISTLARAGIVGAGLITGTLFAFSAFIMAALKRMPDPEGIRAMQNINRAVYTPWFMVPFFGTMLISVATIVLGVVQLQQDGLPLILAGGAYALGVFLITAAGNVPLNKKLDALAATDPEAHEFWKRYLSAWTRRNHARVASGVVSILCYSLAL